ncbi:MAG: DUF4136 domain-containing protein [Coraliomargarita sp.]|nr:DUF4136 domain-containing protein [Coraliomargarita sp.]
MKQLLGLTFLLSLLGLFAGCATPSTVDYDSAMLNEMRAYKTFTVESRDQRATYQHLSLTEITDRRIVRAIEGQMSRRLMTEDASNPDCIVTFFTTTKTKTEVNDLGLAGGYYRRYPYRGWGGYSTYTVDQYEEGTLIVDVIDGKSKQMVWRGAYSKRLGRTAPQEAEVQRIVEHILAEFPPL